MTENFDGIQPTPKPDDESTLESDPFIARQLAALDAISRNLKERKIRFTDMTGGEALRQQINAIHGVADLLEKRADELENKPGGDQE